MVEFARRRNLKLRLSACCHSGVTGKELEKIFRYKVLKMLRGRGKITEEFIRMMDGWRHSGFKRSLRSIPWSVPIVRAVSGWSASSMTLP